MRSLKNIYRLILIAGIFLTINASVFAQHEKLIAFYNLENLFDTIDDPAIDDARYVPDSDLAWDTEKYIVKLDNMAKVIAAVDEKPIPVLGVCEVENRRVLEDLVSRPSLKKAKYQIIHYNSPDGRGIDNALLYSKKEFKVISSSVFPVVLKNTDRNKTRDILYVSGVFKKAKKDTLHLFVNHWPSRWGGREKTIPFRRQAAEVHRKVVDSILAVSENPNIIIMGDLNDEPNDESIAEVLKAFKINPPVFDNELYNLMYYMLDEGTGTLWYKDWDVFDQFIVTGSMINGKSKVSVKESKGHAFGPEWIMFEDDKGNLRPSRTAAKNYYGGFSDHLLVYIKLILMK